MRLFEQARSASLESFARLVVHEDHRDLRGTHPELGTVTLRQLVISWAAHDLNHLRQIVEAMAGVRNPLRLASMYVEPRTAA